MIETVECYIIKDNSYLMLHRNKRKDDMHEGKYIGVGGHIEAGETKEEALCREVYEETGLTLNSYKYCGKVLFQNDDYQEMMYIFTSDDYKGELIDCDEGTLCFVPIDKILDLNIWDGDRVYHPMIRNNEEINIKLTYKNDKFIGWCKL